MEISEIEEPIRATRADLSESVFEMVFLKRAMFSDVGMAGARSKT